MAQGSIGTGGAIGNDATRAGSLRTSRSARIALTASTVPTSTVRLAARIRFLLRIVPRIASPPFAAPALASRQEFQGSPSKWNPEGESMGVANCEPPHTRDRSRLPIRIGAQGREAPLGLPIRPFPGPSGRAGAAPQRARGAESAPPATTNWPSPSYPKSEAGGAGRAASTAPLTTTQITRLTTDAKAPVRIPRSRNRRNPHGRGHIGIIDDEGGGAL